MARIKGKYDSKLLGSEEIAEATRLSFRKSARVHLHGTLATTDEIKHAEKLDLDLAIVLDVAEVNDLYVTGWRRELS